MSLDKNSWGFVRTSRAKDYLYASELIATLIKTVACGGILMETFKLIFLIFKVFVKLKVQLR